MAFNWVLTPIYIYIYIYTYIHIYIYMAFNGVLTHATKTKTLQSEIFLTTLLRPKFFNHPPTFPMRTHLKQ